MGGSGMTTIQQAWTQDLLGEKYSPSKTNRASQMGYNCIRRLYYERMHPEEKTPFSEQALANMREGTEQEKAIRKHLMELGFDIKRSQEPFEFEEIQLSGHWEGFLKKGKEEILFEIKTTTQFTYDKLNTIEDFRSNRWWEGYLKQVTVYMAASHQSNSLFLVKDRSRWQIKEFPYNFDIDVWNGIYAKCNTINDHIAKNKIPEDKYCYSFQECDSCNFLNFCCPQRVIAHEGFKRVSDFEEIDMVARYMQLKGEKKELEKEYKEVDKYIGKKYEGVEGVFFGDRFEMTGKYVEKGEFTVKAQKYWQKTIKEL
jgi:hypothetical protein